MREKIRSLIKRAFTTDANIEIEAPKNDKWGDFSTNLAIVISKQMGKTPGQVAEDMVPLLRKTDNDGICSDIQATKQGFINFTLSGAVLEKNLPEILSRDERYGWQKARKGRVLIEFVSANPTGPLHIGHGRWAVIGDCLANVLKAAGYSVDKEFYVNDAGEQVKKLAQSITARIEGKEIPEGGYAGEYIKELAQSLRSSAKIKDDALSFLLADQKSTLDGLGVHFDKWFFESELHKKGMIAKCVGMLEERKLTFTEGSALWFKSSEFGDDKNRVLIKDDGSPTYFAADIAYHADKFERGYDKLINVWGTDHHGYVARLKAAVTALGYPAEKLEIIIGQLVALYRGKELVRMSKRTGEMITLKEVVDEIGRDATRYFLAKNSPNTHLDFDLELAKSKSLENPVYYVGYAHARIISIIKEAAAAGLEARENADLSLLKEEPERKLMLKLLRFEDEVLSSADIMQPHRLTAYAESLAGIFHNYYHQHRVISDDKALSEARLVLAKSTSIVIRNVLTLLGIKAPDHM